MEEINWGPVRFIPGANRGKYPCCHSVYIEGAGILIDPASDRERLERLRAEGRVKAVWLSHWHEDHFMHLDLFDDLPLAMHPADAPYLTHMDCLLDGYGITAPETRAMWQPLLKETFHFRPRRPAVHLRGGEVIALNGLTVEVLHTPGHTPGHLCFYFREPDILFLGDYDLTDFGPWYGDVASSILETERSVRRLQAFKARCHLAGHETGKFESVPDAHWDRYLGMIAQREAALLELLSAPRRMADIVAAWIVYRKPREPLAFYAHAEQALMGKHLERLQEQGRVVCEGGYFRRV
jgi:glyoxylase-like metal-dependent hydrolase (beta-lactamase superfamily II)